MQDQDQDMDRGQSVPGGTDKVGTADKRDAVVFLRCWRACLRGLRGYLLHGWWPLLVPIVSAICFGAMVEIALQVVIFTPGPDPTRLYEWLYFWCMVLFFALLVLSSGALLLVMLWQLRRRRFKLALGQLLTLLLTAFLCLTIFARVLFHGFWGPSEDHFADELVIPDGLDYAVPIVESGIGPFANDNIYSETPESFQMQVLRASQDGWRLDEAQPPAVPALAALTSTDSGRQVLENYLAAHPEWLVTNEPQGRFAWRCFRAKGRPMTTRNHYYFFSAKADAGIPDHFQYRLGLSLSGKTGWPGSRAMMESGPDKHGVMRKWTSFMAGAVRVEIYDQSEVPGYAMTARTLALLEEEMAQLAAVAADNWRQALPADAGVVGGEPDLQLYQGLQGGIYQATWLCNPGEAGVTYLRAYEASRGTRLSAQRLEEATACRMGWSEQPNELFCAPAEFTIYEGDWGKFYAARFELWFRPDAGGEERLILSKHFRIEGWMR